MWKVCKIKWMLHIAVLCMVLQKQPPLHRFTPHWLHPNVVSGVRPEGVLLPWFEQLRHALFRPANFISWWLGRLGSAMAMGMHFLLWPGYLFLPQKPPMSCLARSSLNWRRERRCLDDGWWGERRSKTSALMMETSRRNQKKVSPPLFPWTTRGIVGSQLVVQVNSSHILVVCTDGGWHVNVPNVRSFLHPSLYCDCLVWSWMTEQQPGVCQTKQWQVDSPSVVGGFPHASAW